MIKRIIYTVLIFLIMLDITYSFFQHYNAPLDGDIAESLVPAEGFKPLYENPFGIWAIQNQQTYSNPNRFFTHWPYKEFLTNVPLFLQQFTSPINSVYLSCAISKTIIQICLILLLATAITGTMKMLRLDFVLAAALVTPLFQTNGYSNYMGVIDTSITYTFSYALPCALLILYFLPFIRRSYHGNNKQFNIMIMLIWIPLGLIVSLGGPLNPGIALIFSLLAFLGIFWSSFSRSGVDGIVNKLKNAFLKVPNYYWLLLIPIGIFSSYSLYLGKYNLHNSIYSASLVDLYLSLPTGIYYQFTQKLAFPVLFLILVINVLIISRMSKTSERKKILNAFKWIGLFSLIYILLLPLGGYRDYRPNILRYDTIMPITLSLFFVFGTTSLFILKNISRQKRYWYIPLMAVIIFIYSFADQPGFGRNNCENSALKKISRCTEDVIRIDNNCLVLSWSKIEKPEDSELNARLLQIWNITDRKVLYYQ